jgi:hypothetical protein
MTLATITPLSLAHPLIFSHTSPQVCRLLNLIPQSPLFISFKIGVDHLLSVSSEVFNIPLAHATFRATTNVYPSADSMRT